MLAHSNTEVTAITSSAGPGAKRRPPKKLCQRRVLVTEAPIPAVWPVSFCPAWVVTVWVWDLMDILLTQYHNSGIMTLPTCGLKFNRVAIGGGMHGG
jgi:hypothetical protein